MILSFKEHFPWDDESGHAAPTDFQQSIRRGLGKRVTRNGTNGAMRKVHTIRRGERYREGMRLQFATGPRFHNVVFDEAVCTGVEPIHMDIFRRRLLEVGGQASHVLQLGAVSDITRKKHLYDLGALACNDGLSIDHFLRWFIADIIANGPLIGQIVHWTDLRYIKA